jgi:hypothetical protein
MNDNFRVFYEDYCDVHLKITTNICTYNQCKRKTLGGECGEHSFFTTTKKDVVVNDNNTNNIEDAVDIAVQKTLLNVFSNDKIEKDIQEKQKKANETTIKVEFPDIFEIDSQIYTRVTKLLSKEECKPDIMHTFLLFQKRKYNDCGDSEVKLTQLSLGWNSFFEQPITEILFENLSYCENTDKNLKGVKVKLSQSDVNRSSHLTWHKEMKVYYNVVYYWVLVEKYQPKKIELPKPKDNDDNENEGDNEEEFYEELGIEDNWKLNCNFE